MSLIFGERCLYGCYIPDWAVLVAAVVFFLMLLAVVILSICLCQVCKRVKKRRMSPSASENTCEADLHYAELQNLPAFSRGQCDGGANLDAQNSDYATVAVLKEDPSEEDCGSHQQREDSGVEDGVRDDQVFVEAESASCDLE